MKRFFHRHQPPVAMKAAIFAGVGAALVISALALSTDALGYSLLMAPFGASCVLLFGAPAAPLSQPANVIGGHVLSAAIGLALHFAVPGSFVVAGIAVGIAVAAMMVLRIVHPPAGATTLVAYLTASSWIFLAVPVAAGGVVTVVLATLYHRLMKTTYPAPVPKS
jgi:CBS-domain-containing membrane protein